MASYDYPFNERIRTLLRVEDLFAKLLHNVAADHEYHHHCALLTLLQILDVVDRAELKLDLLQELDRQKTAMVMLKGNPAIAAKKLEDILAEIDGAADSLRAETTISPDFASSSTDSCASAGFTPAHSAASDTVVIRALAA